MTNLTSLAKDCANTFVASGAKSNSGLRTVLVAIVKNAEIRIAMAVNLHHLPATTAEAVDVGGVGAAKQLQVLTWAAHREPVAVAKTAKSVAD